MIQDIAEERAASVFRQLDENNDLVVNEEEFVSGCLKDSSLAKLLNGTTT